MTAPETHRSPLAGVDDDAWTIYVRRARLAPLGAASPSLRLGMFALTARDLADAGLMTEAHKGEANGHKGVWLGTWVAGRTRAEFLASPEQQLDALARLTRIQAHKIVELRLDAAVGTEIAGEAATLSGLLGVARKAGLGGLRQWLASDEDRQAFPESGALYQRFNGLF